MENIVMHAEKVHLHPEYDDNRLNNDIALIRLQGDAPYTGKSMICTSSSLITVNKEL